MLFHSLEVAENQLAELRRNAARHRLIQESKSYRPRRWPSLFRTRISTDAVSSRVGLWQMLSRRQTSACA